VPNRGAIVRGRSLNLHSHNQSRQGYYWPISGVGKEGKSSKPQPEAQTPSLSAAVSNSQITTMPEETAAADKNNGSPFLAYVALLWLLSALIAVIVGIGLITSETVSDTRLLLAVSLAGAGGAALQASTALVNFIGSRSYRRGWTLYFIVRPLLGAGVALTVYVVLRAAFVQSGLPTSSLNYYGILAISLLSGLLSSSVLVRLTEFYDTVFDIRTGLKNAGQRHGTEAGPATELRRLDRYHGYLVHQLVPGERSDRSALHVWLQEQADETLESTEIDIGEGSLTAFASFYINVYAEMCDVEPHGQALVAQLGDRESKRLIFGFRCPAGIVDPNALLELTQRGRTVAVVSVGRRVSVDSDR
jgi:hypothetical protein